MSPMAEGVYDEAVVEVVDRESMLTDAIVVKVTYTLQIAANNCLTDAHLRISTPRL